MGRRQLGEASLHLLHHFWVWIFQVLVQWMLHIVHFLMKFCPFFSSVVFSSDFHRLCLHEIFCCCRMRKRSISPMQGEQGADDAQITDGWSHYSYPDTTGTKKMKTDGVWICVFICTVFVLFFLCLVVCSRVPLGKYLVEDESRWHGEWSSLPRS